jgi:hypothetical protein
MIKLILVVILAALGGYFSYTHHSKQQNQDKPVVYGESRFTFNIAGREIELVAIGQRYDTEDCEQIRDLVFEKMSAICESETNCVESKHQCKNELASNYMDMLDKQSSRTHYVHLQRQSDNLKGVVLFWGLTDDESLQVCNIMLQKIDAQKSVPVTTQCI